MGNVEYLHNESNGDNSTILHDNNDDDEIKVEIEEEPENILFEQPYINNDSNKDIASNSEHNGTVNGTSIKHIENFELNIENHNVTTDQILPPTNKNTSTNIIEENTIKKPSHFQYTKQHTGLKNISFNVGAAVSPTDKMEFDQETPESFGLLKINRPIGNKFIDTVANIAKIPSPTSTDGLTEQGYFDLKFHHNKLW